MDQFLDGYERTKGSDQKGELGDRQWKPAHVDQKETLGIRAHELSPSEAREVWLEREVQSLRSVLDRMADQTSFKSSSYWSQGFPPGLPNPVSSMRTSGDRDDNRAQHAQNSAPEFPHGDRAQHSLSSSASDLYQGARALHGASTASALPPDGRALHIPGNCAYQVAQDDRALQAFSSAPVCHGDRAQSMGKSQHVGDRLWQPSEERHRQGSSSYGPVHGTWLDNGGGGMSGAKAELPDLPSSASPLDFGDWLHLCGPIMKDLSNQAARWWFLTTAQAKCYYEN